MNKKIMAIVIVIILVLSGGYFGYQQIEKNTETAAGLEITHELGTALVQQNPKKVVVFDYGILDTLDTLEIPVTGVVKASLPTYLSEYKSEEYTDIGTLFEPNFEILAELAPDIIIISGRQQTQYEALKEIAPTVYFTIDTKDYMGSFEKNSKTIGTIFNKEKEIAEKITEIQKDTQQVKSTVEKINKNGLILMTNEGKLSAYGANSRFGIIHNTFGVPVVDENIEVTNHGQAIGYEYIVEKNPDYIFAIDRNSAIGSGAEGNEIFENDVMKMTNAYKDGNIIFLDSEVWYLSTGGIHSTEKMIEEIGTAIKSN